MKRHSDNSSTKYLFRGLQGFLIGILLWIVIAVISSLTLSHLLNLDEKCNERSWREMLANQSLNPVYGCVPPLVLDSLAALATGPGFVFLPSTYPHFLNTQILSGLIIGIIGSLIMMIFKSRRKGLIVLIFTFVIMLTFQSLFFYILHATG